MKNRLHERLIEKGSWYAEWHALPLITFIHFFILVGFGSMMAATIQQDIASQIASVATTIQKQPQSIAAYTTRILQLSRTYRTAQGQLERDAIREELLALVGERQVLMRELMRGNQRSFLMNAIPEAVRSNLPDFVQQGIEVESDIEGTLAIIHIDPLPPSMGPSHEETVYDVDTKTARGTQTYRVRFAENIPDTLSTGAEVRVKGYALNNEIVPIDAANGGGGVTVTAGATVEAAATNERTLVMLVNFTDAPTQPFTIAQITGVVFGNSNSTNSFYQENSFGSIMLSGDVVGWYTIPYSIADCKSSYSRNGLAAEQAAIAAGVPVSNYPRRIFLFNCELGGWGSIGGNPSRAWIGYGSRSYALDPSIYTHEFGHNLGTRHAQWLKCGSKQIDVYTNCTTDEYGDRSDVMGYMWGYYHQFMAARKVSKNWYTGTATVQPVTTSGLYTVGASEVNDASVKALKIAKTNTNESYYVSYRQPIGFDTKLPSAFINGASIHVWNGALGSQTKLIDVTAGDNSSLNAAFYDGATFTDPFNGITITQVSHTASAVTLNVQFGTASCVRGIPTVTLSPLSQTKSSGGQLTYSATVRNNDSTACASSTFALAATAPAGWSAGASVGSVTLAPSASGSASLLVTSALASANGSYSVALSASDSTVTNHSGSGTATYIVYNPIADTASPATAITSPAEGATVSGIVAVTASATDDVGVSRVELWANGALVATDTVSPFAWGWNTSLETTGAHSLETRAYDAAGNMGVSSPVSVVVSSDPDTTAPVVTITSPKNGTKFKGNASVSIQATASDNRGAIARIDIAINGAVVSSCTSASSCSYSWAGKTIKAGTYSIQVSATDTAGNVGSQAISVAK